MFWADAETVPRNPSEKAMSTLFNTIHQLRSESQAI